MRIFVCLAGALIVISCSYGQSNQTVASVTNFPNKIFAKINSKAAGLDDALTKETGKYLKKLAKKEQKIHDKIYKLDSNAAKNLFAGSQDQYAAFQNDIRKPASTDSAPLTGEYSPYVDSIKTSLAFAQKNPQLINASPQVQKEINASLAQFNQLQNNFKNADQIKEYIQQRKEAFKQALNQWLQKSSVKKCLDEYNKQVYYYSAQVRDLKETLNDPDKMLKEALVVLNKIPAFTAFIHQNGQLASLFGISDNYGTADAVVGLQTKDQVQQLLQSTVSSGGEGGMAAFQNSLSDAHQEMDQLKSKLSFLGNGSSDIDMPNFKPNNQKTKPFLKRLELGFNLQTTRANWYFPTTTDIGVSVGYKISNKAIVGIGGSYNIGWGTSINHIHFSSQGVGLRSFVDFQIRKNIYISGGLEANYTVPFTSISQLETTSIWQKSGLIGLSKMVSLPGKLVKKTKVSILFDFLSFYQIPKTQPVLFRVGYNL